MPVCLTWHVKWLRCPCPWQSRSSGQSRPAAGWGGERCTQASALPGRCSGRLTEGQDLCIPFCREWSLCLPKGGNLKSEYEINLRLPSGVPESSGATVFKPRPLLYRTYTHSCHVQVAGMALLSHAGWDVFHLDSERPFRLWALPAPVSFHRARDSTVSPSAQCSALWNSAQLSSPWVDWLLGESGSTLKSFSLCSQNVPTSWVVTQPLNSATKLRPLDQVLGQKRQSRFWLQHTPLRSSMPSDPFSALHT